MVATDATLLETMSCDNCDCNKCKASRGQAVSSGPTRLYKRDMSSAEQNRYSSPKFWCQCGAWKYDDAPCCDTCWKEREPYIDR